jgi:hypothetical protein
LSLLLLGLRQAASRGVVFNPTFEVGIGQFLLLGMGRNLKREHCVGLDQTYRMHLALLKNI